MTEEQKTHAPVRKWDDLDERGPAPHRPDPLKHPVANMLRERSFDPAGHMDTIYDLFDQMEREIRCHRGTFCTDPSLTHTPARQTHVEGDVDTLAAAFQDGFTSGNGAWNETPEHHREMFREGVRSLLAAYPAPQPREPSE